MTTQHDPLNLLAPERRPDQVPGLDAIFQFWGKVVMKGLQRGRRVIRDGRRHGRVSTAKAAPDRHIDDDFDVGHR